MATKAKEGGQLKSKSRSAPTTPYSSSQRKRLGRTGTPDRYATDSTQEKPIPNYLRPTISSGQNSKHQHSESPSKSPIITKKPVEKSASPSPQSKDKARSLKSPLPKPSNSPNSASEKASSYKNAKTAAKAPTTTSARSKSSISMGADSAGATKRKETNAPPQQVAKVLSVEEELKAEGSQICDNAEKNKEESDGNEGKREEILQHAASEESEAARADDTGKEAMLADSSNGQGEDIKVEGANAALKNEETKEKGSPTAYNAVIEEAASKLTAEKRNKVRALVGAFETVMELEGQQSPQKGDKGKNVGDNQHTEEKKAETSRESQYDEEKKAQGGDKEQEQEKKKNVEMEHHIEEQDGGKPEEGSTESMWNGENVEEEVTESAEEDINAAKETTEESSNGNGNGNGTGEVVGSEDMKDASPKDSEIDSSAV